MEFIHVFFLGLFLIACSYAFMYFMQPWKKYNVNISIQDIKPRQIMFKQYQGSYLNIKDCYEQMINFILAEDQNNTDSTFKF